MACKWCQKMYLPGSEVSCCARYFETNFRLFLFSSCWIFNHNILYPRMRQFCPWMHCRQSLSPQSPCCAGHPVLNPHRRAKRMSYDEGCNQWFIIFILKIHNLTLLYRILFFCYALVGNIFHSGWTVWERYSLSYRKNSGTWIIWGNLQSN